MGQYQIRLPGVNSSRIRLPMQKRLVESFLRHDTIVGKWWTLVFDKMKGNSVLYVITLSVKVNFVLGKHPSFLFRDLYIVIGDPQYKRVWDF